MKLFGANAGEVDTDADATRVMRYRAPATPAYHLIVSIFTEQVTVFAGITGKRIQALLWIFKDAHS